MGYIPVAFMIVAVAFLVASILLYFGNRKTSHWYVKLCAFVAWLFPFSIMLMLPVDLSSTLYEKCVTGDCSKPIGHVSPAFLHGFWSALYWTMFNLTWFIIPIMLAWLRSGEFSSKARLWYTDTYSLDSRDSIRSNLIYYTIIGAIGVPFLIYIIVVLKFDTWTSFLAFVMAGANAWGLLLATIMLGYGLVDIPKRLWHDADPNKSLTDLEMQASKVRECMVDAQAEVYEVAKDIFNVAKRVGTGEPLRPLVDRLLMKCPSAVDERGFEGDDATPTPVTRQYLVDLHARVKRAAKLNDREKARFEFLLQNAWNLQDVLSNQRSTERRFQSSFLALADDKYRDMKLMFMWWYFVLIRPYMMRAASILCVVASVVVIWSESLFNVESATLSIPALILRDPTISYGTLALVSMSFILYMCACAYSTMFKVKFFDYRLVGEHHTDEASLLFVGAYLCRLTFPLCYNFLNMATDENDSVFIAFFGKAVNLAPLLGESYNKWLPLMILIFSIIFVFNLHNRFFKILQLHKMFDELAEPSDELCQEGREIINQARALEERKIARGEGNITANTHPASPRKAAETLDTSDFLARYKSSKPAQQDIAKSSSADEDEDRQALFAPGRKGKQNRDVPLLPTTSKQTSKYQKL